MLTENEKQILTGKKQPDDISERAVLRAVQSKAGNVNLALLYDIVTYLLQIRRLRIKINRINNAITNEPLDDKTKALLSEKVVNLKSKRDKLLKEVEGWLSTL